MRENSEFCFDRQESTVGFLAYSKSCWEKAITTVEKLSKPYIFGFYCTAYILLKNNRHFREIETHQKIMAKRKGSQTWLFTFPQHVFPKLKHVWEKIVQDTFTLHTITTTAFD